MTEVRRRDPLGFIRGANENSASFVQPIYKEKTLRIGVSPECDVQIKEKFISPIHCEISFRKAGRAGEFSVALITDKSDNGTYINGELIGLNETVVLYPGCIISIVSKHFNFIYVQAHNSSLNYTYDENFLVPLHSEDAIDNKNKEISVTLKRIGKGSQSEVYLSNVSYSSRHQLACKKYSLNINQTNLTKKEIEILKSNRHANVMSMISEFEKDGISYAFTPFYAGGTLEERINRESPIEEDDAFFIFHQISLGLQYLHQNGIIHCDIKPENILLGDLLEKPRAIIIDFGLSIISRPENRWPSDYGSLGYHSPEMVREELFTKNVDCWALGVIVFQMLSKQHPFNAIEGENPSDIKERILNQEPNYDIIHETTSDAAKDVIKSLLIKDPKQRSTIKDCFSSKWTSMNCKKSFYTSYYRSRKEFKKERAFWFGDEEIIPNEDPKNAVIHPDDDEKLANELKRKRGDCEECMLANKRGNCNACIIKNKKEKYDLFKHECICLNEERFVRRTLEKKPLASYSSSSASSN